jgi:hemerythrin
MRKTYFQWDSDLKTGMKSIDDQHQGLVEIINETLQMCFNNQKISESRIKEIYSKLTLYVIEHFENEENLMKFYKIDTRHKDVHYEAHMDFKNNVSQLFSDISLLTDVDKFGEVIEFLIRWLAYHILNMDKSLVRQIDLIQDENISPQNAYEKEQQLVESSSEPLLKALRALFYLVSEKNKELTKINSELEAKVKQRTESLLKANEKLEQISVRDELTGLFNRRYAMYEIEQMIANYKRYNKTFSLLYIDLDKFKSVNDNYGHEFGDKVLIWIAKFLKSCVRKTDIVCRLGGDEFLIICGFSSKENALNLGSKLNKEFENYNNDEIFKYWKPSLSIGVGEIDCACQTVTDILKKADEAMYKAKIEGGGRVALSKTSQKV